MLQVETIMEKSRGESEGIPRPSHHSPKVLFAYLYNGLNVKSTNFYLILTIYCLIHCFQMDRESEAKSNYLSVPQYKR